MRLSHCFGNPSYCQVVLPLLYANIYNSGYEVTEKDPVTESFEEQYAQQLKEVFKIQAQEQIEQGADALESCRAYAEQGKPEFTLAFLLLADLPEEDKRELLAHSYERRATLSEMKAKQLDVQFHRSFPLIKIEAQKDRQVASAIRRGDEDNNIFK